MSDTCKKCRFHKRDSIGSTHRDYCYLTPKPTLRQEERGYWPSFPPPCRDKQEVKQ